MGVRLRLVSLSRRAVHTSLLRERTRVDSWSILLSFHCSGKRRYVIMEVWGLCLLHNSQNPTPQKQAADEENERVSRMRQRARHAVARLSSQVSQSRANSEAAADSVTVPTPPKLRATTGNGNRSSSTSRLPDSTPSSAGESGHLPRYRRSTGAIREAAQGDLDRRSTSTSPEKPRFSQSPTSERPKGYQSHTERLQSFIREQQRKHPLEMISSGAVTKEDRRQRFASHIASYEASRLHVPHEYRFWLERARIGRQLRSS